MARLSLHLRLNNPEHRFDSGGSVRTAAGFDIEVKLLRHGEISVFIKGGPRWFDIQPLTVLPPMPEGAGGLDPAHSPVV